MKRNIITDNFSLASVSQTDLSRYYWLPLLHDNASVNSSSAHPPPPPGNRGAFANVASPEGGAFAYLGSTPGHLKRGFANRGVSRVFVMEGFKGQDVTTLKIS